VRPFPAVVGRAALAGTLVASLASAATPPSPSANRGGEATEIPQPAATPRPIRLVANEVIERSWARFLARTADTGQRISVRGGLIGLGSYNPRGGADYGLKAPPRHLFPVAGGGNSLNVDPNTGHSYFTNTP
jgi:hypothetical protein